MREARIVELEHEAEAIKEAIHMLQDHAKGYPAAYLDHPAYQSIIKFAEGRLTMTKYHLMKIHENKDQQK